MKGITIDKSTEHQLKVFLDQDTLTFSLENFTLNKTFKTYMNNASMPDYVKLHFQNIIQFYKTLAYVESQLFQFNFSQTQIELKWGIHKLTLKMDQTNSTQQSQQVQQENRKSINCIKPAFIREIAIQPSCLGLQMQDCSQIKQKPIISKFAFGHCVNQSEIAPSKKDSCLKLRPHNKDSNIQQWKTIKNEHFMPSFKRVLRERHKKTKNSSNQINTTLHNRKVNKPAPIELRKAQKMSTQKNCLKEEQFSLYQNECLTTILSQQRQQIKNLISDIVSIKHSISSLQNLVQIQNLQILSLKAKNQALERLQQKKLKMLNEGQLGALPETELIFSQRQKNKWRINKNSLNYDDFIIQNMKVTYAKKSEKNKGWSYIYLQNYVMPHTIFSATVQIHKCENRNIAIGITAQKNAQKSNSWNQKECIQYVGFSRLIFEGGRNILQSGSGIWQGLCLTVIVNLKESLIEWRSERGTEAKLTTDKLKNPKSKYVLFVRFKDIGDCIQFIGQP